MIKSNVRGIIDRLHPSPYYKNPREIFIFSVYVDNVPLTPECKSANPLANKHF